jgi:hypothetical protein
MQLSFGSNPNTAPGQVSFGGDAVDTDANVQPSTTTIKTNSDGSRDITHKTSYAADQAPQSGFSFNSSYNNTAPVAPVAPQQGQLGSGTGMGIMPSAAPATATAPVQTFGQPAAAPAQSIPQVPPPGAGVQVAGPMVPGAVASESQPAAAPRPVAPTPLAPPAAGASSEGTAGEAEAQAAQQKGQANPYAIMQNDPAVADQVRQQHMDILNNNADIRVAAAKSGDTNLPMDVRHMFAMQTADLSRYNMEEQKAKAKVATMSPAEIAKTLQKDHPDGSWTRYLITGILGLTGLNQMEANKLGLGDKTMPVRDPETGASGMIRVSPDGTPTMGINSDGTMMNHQELTNFYAQASQKKVAAAKAGAEYLGPNGEKGRLVTRNLPDGRTDTYIEHGGKRITGEAAQAWIPMSVENAATKAEKQTTEFNKRAEKTTEETGRRKETGAQITEAHAAPTAFNRGAGTAAGKLSVETGTAIAPPTMGGARRAAPVLTAPAAGAQATAPGINTAPPAVAANTGAAPTGPLPISAPFNPAMENAIQYKERIKRESAALGTVAKKSAETVAAAGQVADTIENAQHAIALLDSGVHNISPYGPKIQKLEQYKPGEVPPQVTNTKAIMDMVRSIGGTASQATIKGHLTNQELTFLTENKPDGTDPKYTKQWLEKSIKTLQRAQAQAQAQVTVGGSAENPVTTTAPAAPRATRRYNPETRTFEAIQ